MLLKSLFRRKNKNVDTQLDAVIEQKVEQLKMGIKQLEEDRLKLKRDVIVLENTISLLNANAIAEKRSKDPSLLNFPVPVDWDDCIPFIPPIQTGYVIKVYDGDTITIASKLPYYESALYRFSVRLNGSDCPEMKSYDENERKCANIAKQVVTDLVFNKAIILKNCQMEKYGRILADVYVGGLHVNQHLIEKRLAVAYDGKTKKCPPNWLEYYLQKDIHLPEDTRLPEDTCLPKDL